MSGGSATADCIFCKIVAGEIPAQLLAESEQAVAFRDVAPVAPIHVLIVPRRHLADAAAIEPDDGPLLAEMFDLARRIAEAEGIADSGYRLVMNVGADAGNTVEHLHLHLIGGRSVAWPPG